MVRRRYSVAVYESFVIHVHSAVTAIRFVAGCKQAFPHRHPFGVVFTVELSPALARTFLEDVVIARAICFVRMGTLEACAGQFVGFGCSCNRRRCNIYELESDPQLSPGAGAIGSTAEF